MTATQTTTQTTTQTPTGTCGCGCGARTTRRFARGHDVRLKAKLKRRWREERDWSALTELRDRGWLDKVKELRRFGIEIEFLVPSLSSVDRLAQEMADRGLVCTLEGYNHDTRDHWKITTDSSVGGSGSTQGWVGRELVSPPLSSKAGRRQVELACEALAAVGARVNRSCGLHVHHDARHLTEDDLLRLAALAVHYADETDELVARSRREAAANTYAARFTQWDLDALRHLGLKRFAAQTSRYKTLNLAAFLRHGTVEFRQHQGTVEAEKVLAWVDLGQAMIRAATRGDSTTGVGLADLLEWSPAQQAWWSARRQALAAAA